MKVQAFVRPPRGRRPPPPREEEPYDGRCALCSRPLFRDRSLHERSQRCFDCAPRGRPERDPDPEDWADLYPLIHD